MSGYRFSRRAGTQELNVFPYGEPWEAAAEEVAADGGPIAGDQL